MNPRLAKIHSYYVSRSRVDSFERDPTPVRGYQYANPFCSRHASPLIRLRAGILSKLRSERGPDFSAFACLAGLKARALQVRCPTKELGPTTDCVVNDTRTSFYWQQGGK